MQPPVNNHLPVVILLTVFPLHCMEHYSFRSVPSNSGVKNLRGGERAHLYNALDALAQSSCVRKKGIGVQTPPLNI